MDGHELPARKWEVEEDRPPIHDTNVVEEQPLLCNLYDGEDEHPIFDIYVDYYDPPCDLLVLEDENPITLTAIKINTIYIA